ncbi:uncharacterized protein LOC141659699 [Apium graveolens]|uniref:uncharacterized protein LOC141659699 n=1 Tax=Apium graveolens TaxID=4045 RepID=UPI003D7AF423
MIGQNVKVFMDDFSVFADSFDEFLQNLGEASTEGAGGHGTPITAAAPTAAATGAFQPLWGFRRGDTVVGSTKHAWDWSYHSVTPKDFTDVVATPDLERIKLMGAQSLASSNAYFQGAVRQAESWKRASDKADNALRRQQKKYATLEKKLKRKEEELGESNAELVVLRAEKDKAIDNYLDSEEFAQSMRIRDDSVFPEFFRTGWDTALGTVNEACPDINPADYICPDDEALLQRFRTRVVVSDHVPQDPLLPPPESLKNESINIYVVNRGFWEGVLHKTTRNGSNQKPRFAEYARLNAPSSQILMEIEKDKDFKWPKPLRGDPEKRDQSRYYRFHKDVGHDTDDCRQLKDEIEYLIRRGKFGRFTKGEEAGGQKRDNDRRDDDQRGNDKDRNPHPRGPVINMISGGPTAVGTTRNLENLMQEK